MTTSIFYFTGTGNSLWCARRLSASLGRAEVVPLVKTTGSTVRVSAEAVGLVFPVHIWGLPKRVIDFIKRLEPGRGKYYFALAVNGSQVAATLMQLQRLMKTKGLALACGFEVTLPSNYIPWGGPGPQNRIESLIRQAAAKIDRIAGVVARREIQPVEKGPWWHNLLFSWFYRMSFPHIPEMDGKFRVDAKCNGCGICRKICPSRNIDLKAGKPVWQHRCEQCLACLQWCPQEAIQYGPKTPGYQRYHHPEIKLSDMLNMYTD